MPFGTRGGPWQLRASGEAPRRRGERQGTNEHARNRRHACQHGLARHRGPARHGACRCQSRPSHLRHAPQSLLPRHHAPSAFLVRETGLNLITNIHGPRVSHQRSVRARHHREAASECRQRTRRVQCVESRDPAGSPSACSIPSTHGASRELERTPGRSQILAHEVIRRVLYESREQVPLTRLAITLYCRAHGLLEPQPEVIQPSHLLHEPQPRMRQIQALVRAIHSRRYRP